MSDRQTFSRSTELPDDIVDAEHETVGKTPLPQIAGHQGNKRKGLSQAASDCLSKSERLAAELNHGTVGAEHLVLAMTLVPSAMQQFAARHLEVGRAFQAGMLALLEMERVVSPPGAEQSYSLELKNILMDANEIARNRDNQEISVDDILVGFSRLPSTTSAGRLIRGQRQDTLADEVRETIQALERTINQRFDSLTKLLPSSPSELTPPKTRPMGWIESVLKR